MTGPLARARRTAAFVRHVPARQIAARLALELRRRASLRLRPVLDPGPLARSDTPPQPIFPRRTGMVSRLAKGWRFEFIGRAITTSDTIDWAAPGPGAANQLWRMNLHYMEYLEELGAAEGLALIDQWIAANPPWQPGYWRDSWNSYTVSLRVVVWMQRLAGWPAKGDDAVIHSLAAQLMFLERNLERDLGGNHLIKNIKALAWGSAFFVGPAANRWRKRAIALLAAELPRQILADGVHYERSPSYHAQVFADLLETRHALGGDPLDGALDDALDRMAIAVALLAHPDGGPAEFNDAGLTMAYAPAACVRIYRPLLGRDAPAIQGAFALRSAGYFGSHGTTLSIIADMGRIGPDDLPAHAHADIGSFELSVGSERMIVDQGVYEYVAGAKRQASRSAASHNCLSIDGAEPAEFFGAFRCGRRPEVTLIEAETRADGGLTLCGEHDGYKHLEGAPRIRRRIVVDASRVAIEDRVMARQGYAARVTMLLHPECSVEVDHCKALIRRGKANIAVTASRPLTIEPAMWWPDMGREIATRRLVLTLGSNCLVSSLELEAFVGPDGEVM
ncbi:MAG: alginate lyase family protein [Sphingomonas sp.]